MKKIFLFPCFLAAFLLSLPLNAQTNWTRCSEGLPAGKTVLSLAHIGEVLFAGTDKAGVYRSGDNGDSWQTMPPHNSFTQTQTWSMASIDTFLFAGQRGNGILRTSLNGASWTLMNNGLSNKVVQDLIAVGDTLYAATYGGGVFYSADLGGSWSVLHNSAGMEDHKVFSLAANSTTLYAGTAGINTIPDTGVAYRTPFGDTEWTRINEGFIRNGVHLEGVFAMDAVDTLVFAGTDDVGLFRSTDNGDNWVPVGGYWGDIHAIKIAGQAVYYGTSYGGTFRSLDAGQTWAANNTGFAFGNTTLPYLVKDFLVSGPVIYAASDIGVFKQTVPGLVSGAGALQPVPEQATLSSFPNPFSTHIAFDCYFPSKGFVSLHLYNAVGKVIRTIFQGELPAGTQRLDFDGTGLENGCYYAVLKTPQHVVIQDIVRLK